MTDCYRRSIERTVKLKTEYALRQGGGVYTEGLRIKRTRVITHMRRRIQSPWLYPIEQRQRS